MLHARLCQRLNTAQAPGTSEGASYVWAVEGATQTARCYLLEAVELQGSTWYGPACVPWVLWLPLMTR
jgi:hypothetical protein